KHLDRQTTRIRGRLHHDRRHCPDENQLGDASPSVASDVARGFAAAGGMTDVNCVAKVEMLDNGRRIGRIMIHVVAVADLARTAVAAPVMSDDAITPLDEIEHLCVPVVGTQRPTVVKYDRLSRTPVLVEDFDAVLCGDCIHDLLSVGWS